MRAYEYIITKQTQWALNRGISLIGSKGHRGRSAYTPQLDQNLFEPLEPSVKASFKNGDGNEIIGTPDSPAKMQAVHSSSALGVNIFQYWQKNNMVPLIAAACGLCRKGNNISKKIVFEDKYSIDKSFGFAPNIDVVIYNSDTAKYKRFAIECKFSEAYGSMRHSGLKNKYIGLTSLWDDIPSLYNLAKSISPKDDKFIHLHPAQLIKHILGLKKPFKKHGFRLLYLWYDVLGQEGTVHRNEIDTFMEVVRADGIKFHAMSYQELIAKLSNEYREQHGQYIKYITDRYL
jgi:Restriction Endonuclease associating with ARP